MGGIASGHCWRDATHNIFVSFKDKNAYWKLNKLDYVCGLCAALALILWLITSEPKLAITFAIMADALAGIPTLINLGQIQKQKRQ